MRAGREFATRQEACRVLPLAVRDLLAENDLPLAALRALAVSLGPGSFNGLRVGMAFAKAMAHARRLPVIGIPTPLAWAAETAARAPEAMIAVLQPVRREFLYLTVYAPGNPPESLAPTEIRGEADWPQRVAELAGDEPVTLTGDWPGVRELPDTFSVEAARRPSPSAETLALLARAGLADADPESCFTLRPAYISPSQAERVKGVDLGL